MSKVLQLQFKTADGKGVSLSVDMPKQDLTNEEIYQAMNSIISSNVFEVDNAPIAQIVGARYIERTVTEVEA